jgi:uncharacterized protein (UPF0179 family)
MSTKVAGPCGSELSDGLGGTWRYHGRPEPSKDCRCLVTLEQGGSWRWVGIRAYDANRGVWLNNGEPERDKVVAWQVLPEPATGYYARGILRDA